jgi:transposase
MKNFLTDKEREQLKLQHKQSKDVRERDRLKAILASDEGMSYEHIALVLRIDETSVRRFVKEYLDQDKTKPTNGGSSEKLTEEQSASLKDHLAKNLYNTAKEIAEYVYETYKIRYSRQGMNDWLKRHTFVRKKLFGVPAKADREEQKKFIAFYVDLKEKAPENEPILFSDAFHPTQATKVTYGWVLKGTQAAIPTTAGRKRLNFTGAINLKDMNLIHQETETVNAQSIIQHLKNVEAAYPDAPVIHFITDQGAYYTCNDVKEYLETSRIKMYHLPTYSPNLNPIERLWKLFHKNVSNNKYYKNFSDFKAAAMAFFSDTYIGNKSIFANTINDNFQTLPSTIFKT